LNTSTSPRPDCALASISLRAASAIAEASTILAGLRGWSRFHWLTSSWR
jgi:hypothetical protein